MKAIQFIGTQRSGSNLLRVMLNQLPEISAPHPPHILKTFFPLLHLYGDLNNDRNFMALVTDVATWVNVNPVTWEGCVIDPGDIAARCKERSLIEIFVKIYEQKARVDNASIWCCKSMESVHYFREIEENGYKPFYLFIYRDGRDVALSFMKAIVGPKHIFHLAQKWEEEQRLSLAIRKQVPGERFIEVKYEALIHSPFAVMKDICMKLGVSYTDEIFEYYHSSESLNTAKSGRMWQNLSKPIMADNHDKFERELNSEQLQIFEKVAGALLNELGYETKYWPNISQEPFEKEILAKFKAENEALIKQSIAKADADDLERRRPQEELLKKIMQRKVYA